MTSKAPPELKVVAGLTFPTSAITQTFGFIARKGHGKTYAAGKLVEELLMHAPVIVLDPVGTWYGLRIDADGKGSGLPIPVFGGDHGDIAIMPDVKTAQTLAKLLVDQCRSGVIDVSAFRKGEMKTFVAAFCEELFACSKRDRRPRMVVFEEAQVFAPQRTTPDTARMLGAVEDIVRLGRNCGLGTTLISQRPQSVNKEVLNQVECLFVGQLNAAHERKAIDEWIQEKGVTLDTRDLPSLPIGTMYLWSPGWLKTFQKVTVLKKRTYDASATPEIGAARHSAQLISVDLDELRAALSPEAAQETTKVASETVQSLRAALKKMTADRDEWKARYEVLALNERHETHVSKSQAKRERVQKKQAPKSSLGKGERIVLTAIAQHIVEGITREHITIVTGYKRSTRDAYIQRLRQADLAVDGAGVIRITPSGRAALGTSFKPLPTGDALRWHWLNTLPQGEQAVLRVLCKIWPGRLDREQISTETGYKRSTRDAYIQRLRVRKLVTVTLGYLRASDLLFTKRK